MVITLIKLRQGFFFSLTSHRQYKLPLTTTHRLHQTHIRIKDIHVSVATSLNIWRRNLLSTIIDSIDVDVLFLFDPELLFTGRVNEHAGIIGIVTVVRYRSELSISYCFINRRLYQAILNSTHVLVSLTQEYTLHFIRTNL